jgi:hypothetical protein
MAGSIHLVPARRSGLKACYLLIVALLALLAGLAIFAAPTSTAAARMAGVATVEQVQRPALRLASGQEGTVALRVSDTLTTYLYLPLVTGFDPCAPIPGASYDVLSVLPPPTDRPAEEHADLNLALRGYEPTDAFRGLVDYSGGTDLNAPQLPGLFADDRTPALSNVYQVHQWDWPTNSQGPAITNPAVTLAAFAVIPGETIHVPGSGYDIGGYEVLVLYASADRITLKYTREDNVVQGYTLHVENVCVEPTLLALYQTWNGLGRGSMPALRAGQPFGRARGSEIGVAIRDTGAFLDPRSRKDWWQGR